ncbi:MAG: SAM-dependent methyltransferase [Opitutae bacterium]|nr:SAM-dependent methyltransferase [Opitutae bacterium]
MDSLNLGTTSKTAIIVNQLKAEHHIEGAYPKIYSDPISAQLAQFFAQEPVLKAYQSLSSDLIKGAQSSVLLRSRYVSDCFKEAIEEGCDQLILLGSGFDCYAYQARPEFKEVQFFELDRWSILSTKETLLAQCLYPKPSNLQFCPVDFKTDDIHQLLLSHYYKADKDSFASLLGVTQYIEVETLDRIFNAILKCKVGSTLIFSYIVTPENLDEKEAKLLAEFEDIASASGEPFVARYHPEFLVEKLKDMGFSSVQRFTPQEAQKHYFQNRTDGLYANSVEQIIQVIV